MTAAFRFFRYSLPCIALLCVWGAATVGIDWPTSALAGGPQNGDTRRVQLAHVRRVVVIPPFFGTDTLARAANASAASGTEVAPQTGTKTRETHAEQDTTPSAPTGGGRNPTDLKTSDPKLTQYTAQLRQLQEEVRIQLPQRLAKRAGFTIVPAEETSDALKKLGMTPQQMFADGGRVKNAKFPLPLPDTIRKVSDALHADAVVLGVLDEPRRASGKYLYDPLYGISYEPGFAEAHAGFYLMLPEGTEALHGYMRARIPTSGQGHRPFVLADWTDAQDLMIENLMDEWTYYTPKKS